MDQLKKLFKKHSQKDKELSRRKQVRRSRSLPLRELDKENALKPTYHGKQFLKPGVEFLDSPIGEIPFILQSEFILDICPSGAMDVSMQAKEVKTPKKPFMKILDDFPSPPASPAVRKVWTASPSMPKDKYELSKLCGLPAEDLLPPNPYAPWISPSSTITQRRPVQNNSVKHSERTFTQPPVSRGIYGNARACHSTMTLCSTSRMPLILEPPAPLKIKRRVVPSSASVQNAAHEATRSVPVASHRKPDTQVTGKPMPKGRVPVDVQEADGMWANPKNIYIDAPRFN